MVLVDPISKGDGRLPEGTPGVSNARLGLQTSGMGVYCCRGDKKRDIQAVTTFLSIS